MDCGFHKLMTVTKPLWKSYLHTYIFSKTMIKFCHPEMDHTVKVLPLP